MAVQRQLDPHRPQAASKRELPRGEFGGLSRAGSSRWCTWLNCIPLRVVRTMRRVVEFAGVGNGGEASLRAARGARVESRAATGWVSLGVVRRRPR